MPHDGATSLAARPRSPVPTAQTKACRTTAPDQPADLTGTLTSAFGADRRKHRDHHARQPPLQPQPS
jgi:hypothetical protein